MTFPEDVEIVPQKHDSLDIQLHLFLTFLGTQLLLGVKMSITTKFLRKLPLSYFKVQLYALLRNNDNTKNF